MAEEPSLQDIWRLLGRMNQRFDAMERQIVGVEERTAARIAEVETRLTQIEGRLAQAISGLKGAVEARDFRLDEHGRRISQLEEGCGTGSDPDA